MKVCSRDSVVQKPHTHQCRVLIKRVKSLLNLIYHCRVHIWLVSWYEKSCIHARMEPCIKMSPSVLGERLLLNLTH